MNTKVYMGQQVVDELLRNNQDKIGKVVFFSIIPDAWLSDFKKISLLILNSISSYESFFLISIIFCFISLSFLINSSIFLTACMTVV